MELTLLFLVGSMALILLAAELFTNSVEWLGEKLGLGEGAVGSILAAVGTAMPETMIPIIAIFFAAGDAGHEVGIGAILGAPFMLSTAAFSVTGLAILVFSRTNGRSTDLVVNRRILGRDMGYFMAVYSLALLAAFIPIPFVKIGIALLLIGLYGLYVMRTMADVSPLTGGIEHLHFLRNSADPPLAMILVQFVFALGLMIAGGWVFVGNLEIVAHALGVPVLILSLILAPLATELPEKFNSVLWVRKGKDTLAMGNITGAMVFQSCIPVAIGIAFTPWQLDDPAKVSAVVALLSTGIVMTRMTRGDSLNASILASAGLFYLAYVGYVVYMLQSGLA
ncbi:MAG: sodium:calcium antiporter [Dehalococcoidia bacterium]|nr:sodium:calcium antiporter [Dehalococcoidia bacterium]